MGSCLVFMTPLAGSNLYPASKLPPPFFFFLVNFCKIGVGSNPVKDLISCLDQIAYITASIRAPGPTVSYPPHSHVELHACA